MKNKDVLIIGGNGLIGSACVKEFLNSGYNVISVDIEESSVEHDSLKSIAFDISDTESIESFITDIFERYNISGIVNTSFPRGLGWKKSPDEITAEEMRDNINIHMNAYNLITHYSAEKAKKEGVSISIVNVASIFGVISPPVHLYNWEDAFPAIPYPAIKGGIIAFDRFVAAKYGQYGIRVNSISPGVVQGSKMEGKSDFIEGMKKNMLKRTADPKEIAKPIKFLISEESSFVTGQNLIVDGGWTNL